MEFLVIFLFAIYLLPWIVAEAIEHPRSHAVLAVVLLFGWTGLAWIGALVWVLRTKPGPKRRARLELVRPPPPRPAHESRLRRMVLPGTVAIVGLGASIAAISTDGPPPRVPASGTAELNRARVELRLGPGEGWAPVGEVESPCRLEVVQREGAWRHVWRVEACEGSMTGRSGWVRMEALRPADADAS